MAKGIAYSVDASIFEQFPGYLRGEVVFAEGDTVLTRRWVWRQGVHTTATLETTHVEVNVDGMPPVSADDVMLACGEVTELVKRFCGGEAGIETLSEGSPVIELVG